MRGVKIARLALDLIRVGSDSAPETMMRLALVQAGLPEPALNVVLRNGLGHPWSGRTQPTRTSDCPFSTTAPTMVILDQYRRDIKRQSLTESLGWRELRVQQGDLEGERPFVVEKVRAAAEQFFQPPPLTNEPAANDAKQRF